MSDIRQWLDYNHILLNEAKTEAIVFCSSAVHSPSSLSTICVCGSSISLSLTVCDIGVLLDSRLDMSAQVSNVCRSAYSNLFRIAKIRTILTTAACKTLKYRPRLRHITARLRKRITRGLAFDSVHDMFKTHVKTYYFKIAFNV